MADIVTLQTGATAKNAPLTLQEMDNNFVNLNAQGVASAERIEVVAAEAADDALMMAIALG